MALGPVIGAGRIQLGLVALAGTLAAPLLVPAGAGAVTPVSCRGTGNRDEQRHRRGGA